MVRYLHSQHGGPATSPGKGKIPRVGDAISMWGGPGTAPPGHTGIVYSVSVNSVGDGTIVYLDQNSNIVNGKNTGEDTIFVSHWAFSTHWTGFYNYTSFDWTLQAT